MLAPPWIPVSSSGCGATESVVALLCDALAARGHAVTLFAAPGSQVQTALRSPLPTAHPDAIGAARYEVDHVVSAIQEIERGGPAGAAFDVLHDHCGSATVAIADRIAVLVVHTIHGRLDRDAAAFYGRHGQKAALVAVSDTQARMLPRPLCAAAVIRNPISVADWPLVRDKGEYLLWIGSMDPVNGAHCAIAAARMAGRRLLLAGPVQPGQERYFRTHIKPQLDGIDVRRVGQPQDKARRQLLAHAAALLVPAGAHEPSAAVMVQALAGGTPVIAFPHGAATEIVCDGENGMLVADEAEMVTAIGRLDTINPDACRRSVTARFDIDAAVTGYEAVYASAVTPAPIVAVR